MRHFRRVFIIAALLLVAVFAVLNLLAYKHARSMMHFTTEGAPTSKPEVLSFAEKIEVLLSGINIPRPNGSLATSGITNDYRSLTIPGVNGIRLGAWYYQAAGRAPLVLLFHGYAVDKAKLLPEAAAFREMNCSVLLVDFRGSGNSSESYTTIGYDEADDVVEAVAFAVDSLPHSRLILFGQSMGASAVLRAVGVLGVEPDAIIIEAVFDRLLSTVHNRFRIMGVPSFPAAELLVFWGGRQAGFDGFSHNPVDYAKGVSCPALFLHGTDDYRATIDEARSVFEAAGTANSFIEFHGARHESCLKSEPEQWKETIWSFLNEIAPG